MTPLLYSKLRLSELTGLSVRTIEREIHDGMLRAKKVRGRTLFTPEAISEWLADREAPAAKAAQLRIVRTADRLAEVRAIRDDVRRGRT